MKKFNIRICSLNPETSQNDMQELVKSLYAIAQQVSPAGREKSKKDSVGR